MTLTPVLQTAGLFLYIHTRAHTEDAESRKLILVNDNVTGFGPPFTNMHPDKSVAEQPTLANCPHLPNGPQKQTWGNTRRGFVFPVCCGLDPLTRFIITGAGGREGSTGEWRYTASSASQVHALASVFALQKQKDYTETALTRSLRNRGAPPVSPHQLE